MVGFGRQPGWAILTGSRSYRKLLRRPIQQVCIRIHSRVENLSFSRYERNGSHAPRGDYTRQHVSPFRCLEYCPVLAETKNEAGDTYEEILQSCKLVIPYLDDFLLNVEHFGPKEKVALSWRIKGSDYPMQPYHFSDGSLRFICLTTALLQPNPPFFLNH